jgi:hypothetical protein
MTFQTGIDGFRILAQRTGKYAGQDEPQWCGADGKWTDVWLEPDPPRAARAGVYRHDFVKPLVRIAIFDEYVQTKKDGKPTSMWAKMPANQLAKCAEALALRAAFPEELGGIYTNDEMGQAENDQKAIQKETLQRRLEETKPENKPQFQDLTPADEEPELSSRDAFKAQLEKSDSGNLNVVIKALCDALVKKEGELKASVSVQERVQAINEKARKSTDLDVVGKRVLALSLLDYIEGLPESIPEKIDPDIEELWRGMTSIKSVVDTLHMLKDRLGRAIGTEMAEDAYRVALKAHGGKSKANEYKTSEEMKQARMAAKALYEEAIREEAKQITDEDLPR